MKSFLTPSYTFTPGASGIGTLDLSSIASFDIKKLVAVINQTTGEPIYATGTIGLRFTSEVSGVITLFFDTSAMSSGDKLQVIYEDLGQKTMAGSSPVTIASDQPTIPTAPNISRGTGVMDSNTTRVTLATDGPMVAAMGGIADAVATTDTGSFSLLAFIKKGLQNWTTLIARLPASLGQKTMANAFSVSLASDQSAIPVTMATAPNRSTVSGTVTNAVVSVGLTAVRATVAGSAPSASRKLLIIKPSKNNTGSIYLGSSSVSISNGLEIIGPDTREREFDSGDYYLISDVAAQSVEIIEKA